MNIRIITDSTADLPQHLVDQYRIKVIPLSVVINDHVYLDRIDLDNETYYENLRHCTVLPTTSQPTPQAFIDAYQSLRDEGATHVLGIHISTEMSGTLQSATIAKGHLGTNMVIEVIDSRTVTMGLGLVVAAVAHYIAEKQPQDFAEVIAFTNQIIAKSSLFFLLDSLENLQKGGRIGKAEYLMGSLLNIKPILQIEDGVIKDYERVRGNKLNKALDKLVDATVQRIDPSKKLYCTIGYCDNLPVANELVAKLREKVILDDVIYCQIGNVVITHIGMGAVGIAFYQL